MKRRTPPAVSLVGMDGHTERAVVGRVSGDELKLAVEGLSNLPLITWDRNGVVRLANKAVADMLGLPLDEVVGTPVVDLAGPAEDIERTITDFNEGRFIGVHTHRSIHVRGGEDRGVFVTSRAIEVDGRVGGITAVVPDTEAVGLGRDPRRTWLDFVPVAVGITDRNWVIEVASTEINDLIDRTPSEVKGQSLLELAIPADVDLLRGSARQQKEPRALSDVHFVLPSGGEVDVSVLLAPRSPATDGIRFALVGHVEFYHPVQQNRIADLELRLRRIGAEVRAAGLIDTAATSAVRDHPEITDLSTRQWEILSRLLEGARVSTIAGELHISQSTVRNHLSTIFQRFGVHSQAELVDKFREPRSG